MRAVDSNVLVRLVVGDNPYQTATAEAFIEDGAWVSALALTETIWVLKAVYGRSAGDLAATARDAAGSRITGVSRFGNDCSGCPAVSLAASFGFLGLLDA